jgi:hypothetical protein
MMNFDYFNLHVYLVEYAGVTTFVNTSPTCYVSSHYSIYSKVNEADAWPAHVASQKLGHRAVAHTKG